MACVIPPLFLLCLFLTTMSSRLLAVQTTKEIESYGRDYYVFTPDKIDPARTYWLVLEVGVFEGPTVGTQAHENSGSRNWVERGDCIGISVSFPQGYQVLAQDTDRQLLGILRKLQGDFKLHSKLFLYGHSGGAQFAHRFMLAYPDDVAGCCATSAGTWADELPASARTIPLAISCGEKDTDRSTPDAPLSRIDWARQFAKELKQDSFFYKVKFWPGAGHEGDGHGNDQLVHEAFSLGTSGMVGDEYRAFGNTLKKFNQAIATEDLASAREAQKQLNTQLGEQPDAAQLTKTLSDNRWNAGPDAVSACLQVRQDFATEESNWLADTIAPFAARKNVNPTLSKTPPAPATAPVTAARQPVPPPPSTPVDCVIVRQAPLESYGPDGLMTGVANAKIGQSYKLIRCEGNKAVLEDAGGHVFKIESAAVSSKD